MNRTLEILATSVLVWQIVSLLLNILLSWKTPEAWEAWASANPKGAWAVKALRAIGWDVPKLLRFWQREAAKRAGVPTSNPPTPPPVPKA